MSRRYFNGKIAFILLVLCALFLTGCGKKEEELVRVDQIGSTENRSAEPKCLTPVAGGQDVYGDDELIVDATNSHEGYFYVTYSGENEDIKLQLSIPGSITYTYIIKSGSVVIPLTCGAGEYSVIAYEGMGNGMYAAKFAEKINVESMDEFGPFLYPNYYVNFDNQSKAVALGSELATGKTCDLEVIAEVYRYVTENITYDYDRAANVKTDYVPDVDDVLAEKKGICFDYAALMSSMLRSQRIPTRLEVGYAGDAYHAWISTYVEDKGWINGVIEFDGTRWTLMDPTFAANAAGKSIEEYIGNGKNYTSKYVY